MVFNFEQKPGQTLEKKCMQEQITPRVSIVKTYYNSGRNLSGLLWMMEAPEKRILNC